MGNYLEVHPGHSLAAALVGAGLEQLLTSQVLSKRLPS